MLVEVELSHVARTADSGFVSASVSLMYQTVALESVPEFVLHAPAPGSAFDVDVFHE